MLIQLLDSAVKSVLQNWLFIGSGHSILNKLKILLLFILLFGLSAEARSFKLDDIHFNVYRNGSKIGYHKINFINNDNNSTNAYVEIKFDVTFLGFTVLCIIFIKIMKVG